VTIALIDPGDNAFFKLDWSDCLIEGATLVAVVHTVPSPLTKVQEATNGAEGSSTVRVTGAAHGVTYLVEAAATLSTGETLNRQFPLRCFNG
jgi:hypothetical protein